MNLAALEREMAQKLSSVHEKGEAESISDWVMEFLTGHKRVSRAVLKNQELTPALKEKAGRILERLMAHEPIQYVLNESWFMGCRFYVDHRVLIPRPETEELVEWVISNSRFPVDELHILDVGTGSGCIPISLKRRLKKARVYALDANADALEVAKRNALELGTELEFFQLDFLDEKNWDPLPAVDLLISNPPYIPQKESTNMAAHVVDFEPAMALFVPDEDALLFYRALARFGKNKLRKGGQLFVEVHEGMAEAVSLLFRENGYETEIKMDMQGKQRMVRAYFR